MKIHSKILKISALCAAAAIISNSAMIISAADTADANIPARQETAAHTETAAYNWYCKHTSDHSQPPLDSLLSFTNGHSAYYADTKHASWDDKEKVIYLTFDAGYENGNVEKILDIMKEKEVSGAFFILENLTRRNADLVRRMQDEGHLVCNHTANHKDMSGVCDKEAFLAELKALEDDCKAIGVSCAKFYRPPEGRFSEQNLKFAAEAGYSTVFWSFAYVDWDNNSQMPRDAAIKKVLDGTHNGEVILLHPTSSTNAAILGELIDAWRDMGFTFGTLNELCK